MKKLADISAFERLGVSNTVSDLSVFNGALANDVIRQVKDRERHFRDLYKNANDDTLLLDLGSMLGIAALNEDERILDMPRSLFMDYFEDESKAIVDGLRVNGIAFTDGSEPDSMYAHTIHIVAMGLFYKQRRQQIRERDGKGKRKGK